MSLKIEKGHVQVYFLCEIPPNVRAQSLIIIIFLILTITPLYKQMHQITWMSLIEQIIRIIKAILHFNIGPQVFKANVKVQKHQGPPLNNLFLTLLLFLLSTNLSRRLCGKVKKLYLKKEMISNESNLKLKMENLCKLQSRIRMRNKKQSTRIIQRIRCISMKKIRI